MAENEDENYDPKVDRTRVLEAVYETLKDDTMSSVSGAELRDELGLSDDRATNAIRYLEGERLVKGTCTFAPVPLTVRITHNGVRAMEAAKEQPSAAAKAGMSPYSVVHNHVKIHNTGSSAVQVGTVSSTQYNDFTTVISDELRKFVAEVETQMSQLRQELSAEAAADVESDVALVVSNIDKPRREHVIRTCLQSVRTILENGAGGVATAALLGLLGQIHI